MAKKAMTKLEMINQMAKDAGIAKAVAKAVLESFVGLVVKEVKAGRSLRVASLGTFSLKKVKARKGVNPKTGEQIKITAKKRMTFKPAAQVKTLLNPSK